MYAVKNIQDFCRFNNNDFTFSSLPPSARFELIIFSKLSRTTDATPVRRAVADPYSQPNQQTTPSALPVLGPKSLTGKLTAG